jgi:hypothetical protein
MAYGQLPQTQSNAAELARWAATATARVRRWLKMDSLPTCQARRLGPDPSGVHTDVSYPQLWAERARAAGWHISSGLRRVNDALYCIFMLLQ